MRDCYEVEKEKIGPLYRSAEEEAYRRGFYEGFVMGRENKSITEQEVKYWRFSLDDPYPPGSDRDEEYQNLLDEDRY